MNMRLNLVLAAAVALVSVPAFAQSDAAPRAGQTIRDAKSARLGTIQRVNPNGSVKIIYRSRFANIPADTITVENGVVKTSLTKKEVGKLP
jgi:hypothetical protein